MTNENLIIEMLQNITKGMDDMKAEMKAEMAEMKAELKSEIAEVKQELSEVKGKVDSLGEMVEHTVKLQRESVKEMRIIQEYHKYKIADLEQEVYLLKHKQ